MDSKASTLSRRIEHAPEKNDGATHPIADCEQERVICSKDGHRRRTRRETQEHHRRCRGRCSLGALLIHVDERLVKNRREEQRVFSGRRTTVNSRKVGLPRKRQPHSERRERAVKVLSSPRDLETRQEKLDPPGTSNLQARLDHLGRKSGL